MDSGSVSKSQVILEIKGKIKIKCELKRHLSPSLVGTIIRSLPVTGTIHILGTSGVYVESHIESGGERTRNEFKKGDIAFLSVGHAFCFFHKDTQACKFLLSLVINFKFCVGCTKFNTHLTHRTMAMNGL